ncbi:NAD(P)-binding domain-containing protein [Streptomyces sp. NPDC058579]|uniref:imine reductase family protein n=1 Tax=Streptomyces sp. NPDC058579 TaxID=3346548 RepID=UPI0036678094
MLGNGHPTTVWNRPAGKADALVSEGATLAGSVGDAVAASEVVIVCVSTYEVTRGLIEPLAAQLGGKTLINLTTGTPDDARSTAAWAAIANQDQARVIDEGDYATEISNVSTNRLALGHILQASKELGVDASWLEPVKQAADELVAEGYGNDSFARTFEKAKTKNQVL